jgi:hypothetical protein
LGKKPGTHFTGGWVGYGTGVVGSEKFPPHGFEPQTHYYYHHHHHHHHPISLLYISLAGPEINTGFTDQAFFFTVLPKIF